MKINEILYSRIPLVGIQKHKVIGSIGEQKTKQYIIESQTCSHEGENCLVLVAKTSKHEVGDFKYVSMLNNDGEDDEKDYTCYNCEPFFKSLEKMKEHYFRKNLEYCQERLVKAQENVARWDKEIQKAESDLDVVEHEN